MSETVIRTEEPRDVEAVRGVNVDAFRDHPISRQTEHLIVDALRDDGALAISLVAVRDDRVVGHIAFSTATVGESRSGWYLLGPIAVIPALQGMGIGTALLRAGLSELISRSAKGCVLVGEPRFYGRFGFTSYPTLGYEGVPHEYVLALPLGDETPDGLIIAHEAFSIEPE